MVSVIMGVYNGESENVNKCITSILSQTYKEFELIICDDGSTDNTYNILKEYAQQDERIVLIKNEKNMGLAYTLNHCIKVSKGDLLIRHDIDDYSDPKRFEKQVRFMKNNPDYAFAGSNINLYDKSGIWGSMTYPPRPLKKDFLFALPFMHGSIIMRKAVILLCGGYTVKKITRRTEDFDLFARVYIKGYTGGNIKERLYFYKEDENAQSKRKFKYRIDESILKFGLFKQLGLMPKGVIYAIKPIAVGLIPRPILSRLKDKHYKRRNIK